MTDIKLKPVRAGLAAAVLAAAVMVCSGAAMNRVTVHADETAETYEYPALSEDLQTIIRENEDVTGAIYIPALQLAYPVVWKEYDNTFYMEHDIWQNESVHGCIMIDGWNRPDFSDCITLVHGHNMADGTMFGSLKRFLNDASLAQQEPWIYYYMLTDDGEVRPYRYQIFSYYVTDVFDKTYDQPEFYSPYHTGDWDTYAKETREVLENLRDSWYDGLAYDLEYRAEHALPVPDLTARPHLMLLSTCHAEVHGDIRLVVACARTE